MYLIVEDVRHRRLPNRFVLPLLITTTTLSLVNSMQNSDAPSIFNSLGIPFFVFTIFFLFSLFYPQGLGMGDIKVILLIGLVLSEESPAIFYLSLSASFIAGAFYALLSKAHKNRESEIPFGPFLLIPAVALALATTLS